MFELMVKPRSWLKLNILLLLSHLSKNSFDNGPVLFIFQWSHNLLKLTIWDCWIYPKFDFLAVQSPFPLKNETDKNEIANKCTSRRSTRKGFYFRTRYWEWFAKINSHDENGLMFSTDVFVIKKNKKKIQRPYRILTDLRI